MTRMGFLAVVPRCSGNCTIELHYDGGTEMRIARAINLAAIAGSLLWVVLGFVWTKRH